MKIEKIQVLHLFVFLILILGNRRAAKLTDATQADADVPATENVTLRCVRIERRVSPYVLDYL
ncbi:MAG: hypothetical protein EI684_19465 [Candidatus Viridilinea halotolerans]|uniref:Uncharacterized protein n=1 Tax=Candidatus Viridilinea halotolerans TaxID=2491704 RepID=A0A426TSN9_9CHLR|nr:MAG: hypothetical protein EI684_19465 [Candidatus Viridilinea halotolerans]